MRELGLGLAQRVFELSEQAGPPIAQCDPFAVSHDVGI